MSRAYIYLTCNVLTQTRTRQSCDYLVMSIDCPVMSADRLVVSVDCLVMWVDCLVMWASKNSVLRNKYSNTYLHYYKL